VANFSLTARAALDGASYDYEGLSIRELVDIKLLSVAATVDQQATASNALQSHCGLAWPEVTQSTTSDSTHCLGLQPEQVMLLSQHNDTDHANLANNLGNETAVTDQSDSWVAVELTGDRTLEVLERICPIDLHNDTFTVGRVARTSMEHSSVIVFRQADRWLLLSPRSSAESFMHSLTQSADFVI